MLKIEKNTGQKCDIMVMVQGDEPLTYPQMIDESVEPMLKDSSLVITNLVSDIDSEEAFENSNEVKVVMDQNNNALYFSREAIPSRKKGVLNVPMKKQVCVIPFKRDFLLKYNKMSPTPLEIIESVDMMRILENGGKVKMCETKYKTKAVDSKEDLDLVIKIMKTDQLFETYR